MGGVEVRPAIAGIAIEIERTTIVIRFIDTIVVDAIRLRPEQRIVPVLDERHRQTRTEMGDPREFPALCPAVGGVEQAFAWKLVVVTHNKVLPDVK